jgi:hypothetical protein
MTRSIESLRYADTQARKLIARRRALEVCRCRLRFRHCHPNRQSRRCRRTSHRCRFRRHFDCRRHLDCCRHCCYRRYQNRPQPRHPHRRLPNRRSSHFRSQNQTHDL